MGVYTCVRAAVGRWEAIHREGVRGQGALCACHELHDQKKRVTECQALYLKCYTNCLHGYFVEEKKNLNCD